MPALNFKKEFKSILVSGSKTQTIRKPRKNPIKPGDTIYIYTGQRTSNCEKLGEGRCTLVRDIMIYHDGVSVCLEGKWEPLGKEGSRDIARKDGFSSVNDLANWFKDVHGLPFKGQLIRWAKINKSA